MTDGVAVSVIMGKWVDPATATQREEQEQQGEWNRLGRMLEIPNPRCIGIDPGRKDWVAYAEEDEMNENGEVTFEDASFNNASKGHAPAPRRLVLRNRLINRGFHVVDVGEYNTSQVCSKCHAPLKVCDV